MYEWNYAGAVQFEFPGDLLGEVYLYHVENISPLLLKCAKGFFQRQSRISSQVIFWEEWSSKYLHATTPKESRKATPKVQSLS